MERKEVEKKLKQSAKKIKSREFSSVWDEIKDQIEEPQEIQKTRKFPQWAVAIASVLSFVLVCTIVISIIITNKRYVFSELIVYTVAEDEFCREMDKSGISVVDFSGYFNKSFVLYKTKHGKVKGGEATFANAEKFKDYFLSIKFLSQKVDYTEHDGYEYINSIAVGGYAFYQTQENYILDEDAYISYLKGEYNGANCFIRMGIVLRSGSNDDFAYQNYNAQRTLDEVFL